MARVNGQRLGKIGLIVVDIDGYILDTLFDDDFPTLTDTNTLIGTNITKHLFDPKAEFALKIIRYAIKSGPQAEIINTKTKTTGKIGIREARIIPRDHRTAYIVLTAIKNINHKNEVTA